MPKGDPEITMCMKCEFRPKNSDTGEPVEGGLKIGMRNLGELGNAVVIYSTDDVRHNTQSSIREGYDNYDVTRAATRCTPMIVGLNASLGVSFERRLLEASLETVPCTLKAMLKENNNLPPDLLYQTSPIIA